MRNALVKISGFTLVMAKGLRRSLKILFLCALLTLPGCVTSQNSEPLAPNPPVLNFDSASDQYAVVQPHYFVQPEGVSDVEPSAAAVLAAGQALKEQGKEKGCSIKDRFDREAFIAYEWDRSRMALDVDGIGIGDSDVSGLRLEYTIRLQPEKSRKQKCRYNAKWQGLLGSGYNELIIRKDDTVWEALRAKQGQAMEFLGVLF